MLVEWIPLLVVTLAYIGTLAYSFTTAELEGIRQNWNTRRCEPLVMTMAQLVPTDPNVDKNTFATENFSFCIGKLIDSSLGIFFKPFMALFGSQMELSGQMQQVTGTLRTAAASLMKPFSALFEQLFMKFRLILFQFLNISIHIKSALQRIEAILVSKVFLGMSMMRAILNSINYVIRVVLIILAVLVVLVIFLWFVLFPYVPIILTVIGIIVTTAAGAAAGGMAASFCVAPTTEVAMEDGSWKQASAIQPGDRLAAVGSENVVEGVLHAKGGPSAPCVSVKGVVLSADHLVYDHAAAKWVYAKELPGATPVAPEDCPPTLICLNTITHTWTVRGEGGSLLLRDWEEIPTTPSMDAHWEALVYEILNRAARAQPFMSEEGSGRGLFGDQTTVEKKGVGVCSLQDVRIGDYILDKDHQWTEVLAVYHDNSVDVPMEGPNNSVWMWYDGKRVWKHPFPLGPYGYSQGMHLITASGTFLTFPALGEPVLVRDFTEVGIQRLHQTYPFTLEALNNPTR